MGIGVLSANRVAAITTWLSGLAALILGVEGTFPAAWQNAALAMAGLLTKVVTMFKFLEGSQRSEALQTQVKLAGTPAQPASTAPAVPAPPPVSPATPAAIPERMSTDVPGVSEAELDVGPLISYDALMAQVGLPADQVRYGLAPEAADGRALVGGLR